MSSITSDTLHLSLHKSAPALQKYVNPLRLRPGLVVHEFKKYLDKAYNTKYICATSNRVEVY